jgi:hypothetical protein
MRGQKKPGSTDARNRPESYWRNRFSVSTSECPCQLLILILIALAPIASLHAGPKDLKAIAAADVKDLTIDTTYGALYFIVGGQNYVYLPNPNGSPVSLAELSGALRSATTIFFEEARPRQTLDYYDGQPALLLSRILVKPGR